MKKILVLLLTLTLVFSLAGCRSQTPPLEDKNGNNRLEDGQNSGQDTDTPGPEDRKVNIRLYYANKEYIETGDSSLDSLIAIEEEVEKEGIKLEEYILERLSEEPDQEKLTTIVDKVEVLGVESKENTAYVDLAGENLHGSSLEESFILQQIVFSLTELEGIDQVQFLVDGRKQESLMGHINIDGPLKRLDVE